MRLYILLVPLALGACATHTWAPGPGMSAEDFGPAKARCSMEARHGGSGFAAEGTPAFVAGAAVGAAIGESIRAQSDFNDCMQGSGWQIADRTDAQAKRIVEVKRKLTAAGETSKLCIGNVRAEAKYSPIVAFLSDLNTGSFSMEQISNNILPTPDETKLMAKYYDEALTCKHQAVDAFTQLVPAAAPVWEKALSESEANTKRLVSREITWGDFAQSSNDAQKELKAGLSSIRL